jgi:hypothetical protein
VHEAQRAAPASSCAAADVFNCHPRAIGCYKRLFEEAGDGKPTDPKRPTIVE